MSKHKPVPWKISGKQKDEIRSSKTNNLIAVCTNQYTDDYRLSPEVVRANAQFICRACNCHNELVAILTQLVDGYCNFCACYDRLEEKRCEKPCKTIQAALNILQKTRGEK